MASPLMVDTDNILPPGTTFGRYSLGRRLGKGGMGVVYEATHLDLRKQVAIKMLLPAAASNPEARARFVREGEAAARLRHPHVVDITDVGVHDGTPYLVMEFLDGENLADLLRREGSIAVEELADIMLPVLDGVSAAHAAGIVHRDMKPENIFLARTRMSSREPKILDFGISKLIELGAIEPLTATNTMVGTAYYMSPEQAQNSKDVDARTDQYSLGVVLYECATGRHPFASAGVGDSLFKLLYAITKGDFEPPRSLRPTLADGFEQAVLRAMATNREDRFPSVQTLAHALLPHASPATRYTWTRVLGAPSTTIHSARSSLVPPDDALDSEPTTAFATQGADTGDAITAPSQPPETPLAPRPQAPEADDYVSHANVPVVDTLGISVTSFDIKRRPRPDAMRWKIGAALGVVAAAGLLVVATHHTAASAPPVTSIPQREPLPSIVPPAAVALPVTQVRPVTVAPVAVLPTVTDAGARSAIEMPAEEARVTSESGVRAAHARTTHPHRGAPTPLAPFPPPAHSAPASRFPNL